MSEEIYDSIIIGGGPAGLSALLYLGRGLTNSVLFEKMAPGGQMLLTSDIENYLGFPGGINAFELVDKMEKHAKEHGLTSKMVEVDSLKELDSETKLVVDKKGNEYKTKTVIIASGAKSRKLGVKGEDEFQARGVSYCGTCDGAFFKDKTIAVIGGGDTAFDEALFLTRFAKKIYLIHRRQGFRAAPATIEKVKNTGKVEFVLDTVLEEIYGEKFVTGVKAKNVKSGEINNIELEGVFIFIGLDPVNAFIKDSGIEMNDNGYVVADINMHTNKPGVFVCGDIVAKEEQQVANAVGEGAVAACQAIKYIE